jgi:hypothetical protein
MGYIGYYLSRKFDKLTRVIFLSSFLIDFIFQFYLLIFGGLKI